MLKRLLLTQVIHSRGQAGLPSFRQADAKFFSIAWYYWRMERVLFGLNSDEWYRLGANPGSEWFGTWKDKTKDCVGCPALQIVDGQEWCLMGVGKRMHLKPGEKLKKCTLINRETRLPVESWPPR